MTTNSVNINSLRRMERAGGCGVGGGGQGFHPKLQNFDSLRVMVLWYTFSLLLGTDNTVKRKRMRGSVRRHESRRNCRVIQLILHCISVSWRQGPTRMRKLEGRKTGQGAYLVQLQNTGY